MTRRCKFTLKKTQNGVSIEREFQKYFSDPSHKNCVIDKGCVPKKTWQKLTFIRVCTAYIFLSFWPLQKYLYLVYKYSSLLNRYFLVCIFKYPTSLRVNSGLEILGYYFYSKNLHRNITKKITAAATTADGKCVLVCEFIGRSWWPLSGIIRLSLALTYAPVSSWEFLCVPVHSLCIGIGFYWTLLVHHVQSCALNMASNRHLF